MNIRFEIEKYDKTDMFKTLSDFPNQIEHACDIGENSAGFNPNINISELYVLGMGGSAIGGDILRSFCSKTTGLDHIDIKINRTYDVPSTMNSHSHIIASSYSGGTEETISGFKAALSITKNMLSITTGGKLKEISDENHIPTIDIPDGMMPRCAIGYSFFPMLYQVINSEGVTEETKSNIETALLELKEMITNKSKIYSDLSDRNPALIIAKQLKNKATVIYSSDILDVVNLRWRGQIQENAKSMAFGNLIPEMNHNEINSFAHPIELSDKIAFIFLTDKNDHPKIKRRIEAVSNLLGKDRATIILSGKGENLLTRIFELIYLADWTSYYLAILNEEDPTPIPMINELKTLLSD